MASPVGIVLLGREESTSLYLDDLFIVESARRQGHGRALMDTSLELAQRLGYASVELTVTRTNSAAIALYESLGFSVERYRMRCAVTL